MPKKIPEIKWMDLNKLLRETEDEKQLKTLLDNERKSKNRPAWVLRIYQRLNQVRRVREQRELLEG